MSHSMRPIKQMVLERMILHDTSSYVDTILHSGLDEHREPIRIIFREPGTVFAVGWRTNAVDHFLELYSDIKLVCS